MINLSILIISALVKNTSCLKVLVAGSLEPTEHKYFESVARYLVGNTSHSTENNVVYQLFNEESTNAYDINAIDGDMNRYFSVQIGENDLAKSNSNDALVDGRASRFQYNSDMSEFENYIELDLEHTGAYFGDSDQLISLLKSMKFDVGIGSLYHADSLLFRALGLNYIKISPEDIEAHVMQFKLGMPVMQTTYPFAQVSHYYGTGRVPHRDSYFYRRQFTLQYEYNRWFGRPRWMQRVRKLLPEKYHKSLLDNFDQDHALILAEGTNGLVYQSIMLKPSNIQPVFSIRDEAIETRTYIKLDSSANEKTGPVIIFDTQLTDKRNVLRQNDYKYLKNWLQTFNDLVKKRSDINVIILHEPDLDQEIQSLIKNSLIEGRIDAVVTRDSFNLAFDTASEEMIQKNKRQLYWLGQCTQTNFLTAFEKFHAVYLGFADIKNSHSQTFNCDKLAQFNVGHYIDLEEISSSMDPLLVYLDQPTYEMKNNITFNQLVLTDDQRILRSDFQYWLEFVHLFGVEDMIPDYDHSEESIWGAIAFRNYDVYIVTWPILWLWLQIWYTLLFWRCVCLPGGCCLCCCRCCKRRCRCKSLHGGCCYFYTCSKKRFCKLLSDQGEEDDESDESEDED